MPNNEPGKARERSATQDRGYVNPAGRHVKQVKAHRDPRLMALLSIKVSQLIKLVSLVGFNPGELQGGRVGSKSVEQVLVKGGDAYC